MRRKDNLSKKILNSSAPRSFIDFFAPPRFSANVESGLMRREHNDHRPKFHAFIKINDVFIGHADAA
jgi:hypothetical protein